MNKETTAVEVDELIVEIADRLANEEVLDTSLHQMQSASDYPVAWEPTSLAMGPLGNAILFLTLHYSGMNGRRDWKSQADKVLERYADEIVSDIHKPDSLFGGAGGVLLAFIVAADSEPRWHEIARTLAEDYAEQVLALDQVPDEGDVSDADYDMINGRAGALLATSIAVHQFPASIKIAAACNRLFDDADELLSRGETIADTLWINPKFYPFDDYAIEFPEGYYNMGVSHGLPGILVALAGANVKAFRDQRRKRLTSALSAVILDKASSDAFGLAWPSGYERMTWRERTRSSEQPLPNAWCYGAPGVALSLARAARTLRDTQLNRCASKIMRDALCRYVAMSDYTTLSPSFCHGIAGILACSIAVLGTAELYESGTAQNRVMRSLLSKADMESPLVFQDFEEHTKYLDNPTVIQGAAGIALTLTLARGILRSPGWQNLFGIE